MGRDILDRLRSPRYASASDPFGPLCDHAAAEIEALRAERDAAVAHIRKWERWQANRPSEAAMTAYAIRGGVRPAHADPPPPWDGVRRAAGLEEEAPR